MVKLRGDKKQDALLSGEARYCGVAAATIGAAVIGGAISSNSAKKATKAQSQAANDANNATVTAQREAQAFQQRQADQARTDREPWRIEGGKALNQLAQGMAPGGDLMRNFGMSDFQQDPGYAFRQAEGMKGMTNSAAARGNLLSGAALKAASRYNQDFASNEFGNAFARYKGNQEGQYNKLASLAGVGQIQANQNGSSAMQLGANVGNGMMNSGQSVGNNLIGAGDARASGYLAQGNALTNAMNQGVSAWNQHQSKPPTYGQWSSNNAGVMNSTGLSENDLLGGF